MTALEAHGDRTPVHVLTGFLGAGKTTLLNRALCSPGFQRSAVVVNEFGDVGIDHLLVESSDDALVTLSGGCVCCAVRGDLAATLAMLLARRDDGSGAPFERIVIETSGLAEPNPIVNLLVTDALLAERLRLATLVTVVDAVNGAATLAHYAEARAQAALADRILVTKSDLAPPRAVLEALAGLTTAAATVLPTDGPFDPLWLAAAAAAPATAQPAEHHHTHGIHQFTLERDAPLPGAALALFVELLAAQLGAELLRVKGLVALAELPDRPAVLHGAQHVFHPLDVLPAWPTGSTARTRIVFITRRDVADWLARALDMLVWETHQAQARLDSHDEPAAMRRSRS